MYFIIHPWFDMDGQNLDGYIDKFLTNDSVVEAEKIQDILYSCDFYQSTYTSVVIYC